MDVNIIQGLFTFVSGEIARAGPDAMTIYPPPRPSLRDSRDPGHESGRTRRHHCFYCREVRSISNTAR